MLITGKNSQMSGYLPGLLYAKRTNKQLCCKPRITPLPFTALKINSCVRVMLLFLADRCISALSELQETEIQDMGHLTGNPLSPLSIALRTDKSPGVTSSYSFF